MNAKVLTVSLITAAVVVIAASLAGGYWWGANRPTSHEGPGRTVASSAPASAVAEPAKGKILYYRNPMGLPDTSPVPKKDPMGMDYVPVYADEDEAQSSGVPMVKLSLDKVQKLGVRTEAVALLDLGSTVRAVATVQPNERLLSTVTSKFDGWIQKLYVNTTGQAVRRGEPLMDVYSPDLITAQQEYLIAKRGVNMVSSGSPEVQGNMQRLMEGAVQRLRNWDISEAELSRLEKEGKVRQYLTLRSPANGVVLEKPAIQGKRFTAGEVLYQIADLSSVWLLADVFEQDLAEVRIGRTARVTVDAYPGKVFTGKVTFVYPTLNIETRTAKVRVELANPGALLKPSMYARAEFTSSAGQSQSLTVPDSAVLDTGMRQLVLVQRGEGKFEPRAVKLGKRGDGYIQVLEGVKVGENVVVSANFLIDAESNLKAALGSFGQKAGGDPAAAQPQGGAAVVHHAEGRVEAVDRAHSRVTLAHGPVASLNWPAMTMDFKVKDPAVLRALSAGQQIKFDISESGGEWIIVRADPVGSAVTGQGR